MSPAPYSDPHSDPYSDWDAAYVIGALSPADRREFERHLAGCDSCSAAIAELAGLPGLLAKASVEDIHQLVEEPTPMAVPATLMPRLVRSVTRRRRRARAVIAGSVAAAAGIAAALVLVIPLALGGSSDGITRQDPVATDATSISLSAVVPNTLTASLRLVSVGWGTRVEMDCHYGPPPSGYGTGTESADQQGLANAYEMFVTDAAGNATQIASWTALPGADAEPSGTTSLALADIKSIDIRSAVDGRVLLRGAL
jgi:hypothetical protein